MAAVVVNQNICIGCGICIKACPEPNVIKKGGDRKVVVNTALCKMCLLCASVCPKSAITAQSD